MSSTAIYGLAGYIPRLVNLLILPLYTIYLTPEELGTLDVFVTISSVATFLFQFGLPAAYARIHFDESSPAGQRTLLNTTLLSLFCVSIFWGGLLMLFSNSIFPLFGEDLEIHPWVEVALLSAFCMSIIDLITRYYQNLEKALIVARIGVILGVGTTIARATAVLFFKGSFGEILFAELIVTILGLFYMFAHPHEHKGNLFCLERAKELFKVGVPFAPYKIFVSTAASAPAWVLSHMGMRDIVGILGIAQRVTSPMFILYRAYTKSFSPIYYSWRQEMTQSDDINEHKQREKFFRDTADVVFTISAVAGLGAITFGRFAIETFLDPKYLSASVFVPAFIIAQYARFLSTIGGNELMYNKRSTTVSIISFCTASVAACLSLICIPLYGAWGAIIGMHTNVVLISLVNTRFAYGTPAWKAFARGTIGLMCATLLCCIPIPEGVFTGTTGFFIATFAWAFSSTIIMTIAGISPKRLLNRILSRKKRSKK